MKILKRILIALVSIILSVIVVICIVLYTNLFSNVKSLIVTSLMTTYKHQYIIKHLLSEKEIDEIMKKNTIEQPAGSIDDSLIKNKDDSIFKNNDTEVNVEVVDIKGSKYEGKMMIVHDASKITLGISHNLGKTGEKLSDMCIKYGYVGGINAGGFADENGTGMGGNPTGIVIKDGRIIYKSGGNVFSIVGFNKDNVFVCGRYSLSQIENLNIRDAISFGPILIFNGAPQIIYGDGGWGIAPRTVIGQKEDGTVLMLVIDGRQIKSIGATLKDAQDIMTQYGAVNAVNLDGGASSVMFYNGKIQNSPSSKYGERYLPTAFLIKP